MFSRRSLIVSASAAAIAAPLSSCAWTQALFSSTDYLGEAAAAFTGGAVALTALTTLVQTGVVAKAKAQTLVPAVNAMAAEFATLHSAADTGTSLGAAIIQAAQTALNGFQVAVAPIVAPVTPAQTTAALAHLRAHKKFIAVGAIIAWVLSNLDVIVSASKAVAALVEELIAEYHSLVAGSTTVAQVDAAYQDFTLDLANFNAAIA